MLYVACHDLEMGRHHYFSCLNVCDESALITLIQLVDIIMK